MTTSDPIVKPFTPIEGKPTPESVALLRREANEAAMAMHNQGNLFGHLGVTMPAAAYLLKTGAVYVEPADPGAHAVHADGATGPQIVEANRQYDAQLVRRQGYQNVIKIIKPLLIGSVNPLYLADLDDEDIGFAAVSIQELLEHLELDAVITADMLNENLTRMGRQYNPSEPFEVLILQLDKCMKFAIKGCDPITEASAVRSAVANMEATGVFSTTCSDWRKKAAADQTLATFTTEFKFAVKEYQRKIKASEVGYNSANNAQVAQPPPATAPSDTGQHFYCWSHGLSRNPNHSGATCQHPAEGHRSDATLSNMMGGNNQIRRENGETTVYRPPRRAGRE
jgi:hypothetical protein